MAFGLCITRAHRSRQGIRRTTGPVRLAGHCDIVPLGPPRCGAPVGQRHAGALNPWEARPDCAVRSLSVSIPRSPPRPRVAWTHVGHSGASQLCEPVSYEPVVRASCTRSPSHRSETCPVRDRYASQFRQPEMTRRFTCCLALLLFALATPLRAEPTADSSVYAVIPRPSVLTPAAGHFTLTARSVVRSDPAFAGVARRFVLDIAKSTGFDLPMTLSRTPAASAIRLVRVTGRDTTALGAEGYRLDVTPSGVIVRAAHAAGAFYALESFKQLLPAAIFRDAPIGNVAWRAPAVHIEDVPRFVLARRASRRGSALHAEGVREEVHRSAGASQDESLSLASDRRPGMADRDQEVSAPD